MAVGWTTLGVGSARVEDVAGRVDELDQAAGLGGAGEEGLLDVGDVVADDARVAAAGAGRVGIRIGLGAGRGGGVDGDLELGGERPLVAGEVDLVGGVEVVPRVAGTRARDRFGAGAGVGERDRLAAWDARWLGTRRCRGRGRRRWCPARPREGRPGRSGPALRLVMSSVLYRPVSLAGAGSRAGGLPGAIGGVVSRMKLSWAKLPLVPDWSVAWTRNIFAPSVQPSLLK